MMINKILLCWTETRYIYFCQSSNKYLYRYSK